MLGLRAPSIRSCIKSKHIHGVRTGKCRWSAWWGGVGAPNCWGKSRVAPLPPPSEVYFGGPLGGKYHRVCGLKQMTDNAGTSASGIRPPKGSSFKGPFGEMPWGVLREPRPGPEEQAPTGAVQERIQRPPNRGPHQLPSLVRVWWQKRMKRGSS